MNIEFIDILPALFERIVIPSSVVGELVDARRSKSVREYFSRGVSWLDRKSAQTNPPIAKLDPGETEALNLAIELHADLVLVDERRAFRAALAHHLNPIGTLRVLELAAEANLIDLATAFDRLRKTDFWISEYLLVESLRLHKLRKDEDHPK